jgi:hypothetical protein
MDVNSLNAIAQERARIREAVVKLKTLPPYETNGQGYFIDRADVLAVLDPMATVSERKETPTVITSFPGEAVDRHLKLYGHLPELGCCEHDQPLSACCNARMVAGGTQCEACGSNGQ